MRSTTAAAQSRVPPPPRPRKPANPLVKPKRPIAPQTQIPNASSNPSFPLTQHAFQSQNQHSQQTHQRPQESYEDIPIYTTRKALVEGTRHHIMRLFPSINVDTPVDPRDHSQFTPPIRLHRRDPRRDPAPNVGGGSGADSDEKKPDLTAERAREEATAAKAARAAERDVNRAQIAPTVKSEAADQRKKHRKQKKVEMVFHFTDSAPKVKSQKIKYEETMPWHLEDFDKKNLWAGTYESALSERHILLVEEPESKTYRMVPLEKWYKFLPKGHIKTASHEDAERRVKKPQTHIPDLVRKAEAELQKKNQNESARTGGKLYTRQGERGERPIKDEGGDGDRPEQNEDADVLDYDYDEAFADDEEPQLFGGDEDEIKEAEQKVKRERGDANIFKDIKQQKDFDEEEEDKKRQENMDREKKKTLAKALKKRERDWRYEDDSDELSDSSEDEVEDIKDEKTEEERRKGDFSGMSTSNADKARSGLSNKGSSTPIPDGAKIGVKRPASPSQSDLSGNESSRKKQKMAHFKSNVADVGASISRTSSPASQLGGSRKASIKLNTAVRRNDVGAASGSEGEMSDRSKGKRKSRPDSRQASPNGSRASSPANGVRAPARKDPADYTEEDIRLRVGHEGVSMSGMLKIFGNDALKDATFVGRIKKALTKDKTTKLFKPRPQEPSLP